MTLREDDARRIVPPCSPLRVPDRLALIGKLICENNATGLMLNVVRVSGTVPTDSQHALHNARRQLASQVADASQETMPAFYVLKLEEGASS